MGKPKVPKVYYIPCPTIDGVLPVKVFNKDQLYKIFTHIQKKIVTSENKALSINSYMKLITSIFIKNSNTIVKNILEASLKGGGPSFWVSALRAIYEAVLEVYPPFRLENVCLNININTLYPEKAIEIYSSIGDFENPIEKGKLEKEMATNKYRLSSKQDISRLEKYLNQKIIGQSEAIKEVVNTLKLIATKLSKRATFCFLGPTGVGKTQLAKLLGTRYSGNFFRVDCGEYSQGHEYAKLIGSPPGYIGHSEKSILGDKAEKSNKWILLFDEIEKAHPKLHDFLLSLMDEGYVTDNLGNHLDFSESIIIFTSNQGVSDIKLGKRVGFGTNEITYGNSKEDLIKSIKDNFKKEFLNRVEKLIIFNPLTEEDVMKIAFLELKEYPIVRSENLLKYIVDNSFSQEYGAREVSRFIKSKIAPVIADVLLDRKIPKDNQALYSFEIINNEVVIIDTVDKNAVSKIIEEKNEPNKKNPTAKEVTVRTKAKNVSSS